MTHHEPVPAPHAAAGRQLLSEHTVLSLLTSASKHLHSLGFDEARLHVEWMLARTLGLKRLDLYLQFDRPLTREEVDRFKALYRRRLEHEPLQYILGDTEFMGRMFLVDRRVLIPRPETELLVERAVELLGARPEDRRRVLDVGTGSGNIALCVAAMVPGVRMTAIDSSAEALEVATRNGERLLPGGVEFLRADIPADTTADISAGILPGRVFDMVLANPPYIPLAEYELLQPEVRDWEPRGALTDGEDGTRIPRGILVFSSSRLVPDGTLLMEIGAGQSARILPLAAASGLQPVMVHADHAGIPRVLEARRPPAGEAAP